MTSTTFDLLDELTEADRLDFLSRRYGTGVFSILLLHSDRIVVFDRSHKVIHLIVEPATDLHALLAPTLEAYARYCAEVDERRAMYDIADELEDDGDITINL